MRNIIGIKFVLGDKTPTIGNLDLKSGLLHKKVSCRINKLNCKNRGKV